MQTIVVLDNIRSAYNVGSIFRTCDAAGVIKLYLCGATTPPMDRFGRKRSDVAKTALGAEDSLEWEYFTSTLECIQKLKAEGIHIIAVEQNERSVRYDTFEQKGDTAFVFGDEVRGVSTEVLDASGHIIEIPMKGNKESLNVAVSVGIVLFR